jgi:HAD superfamily hydrolase (TIGR01509 family)
MLLSNTNETHWRFLKAQLPLVQRFHHLVLSYELRLAKPDPEIFREALRWAGADPAAAVFFDDLQRFVDAARAVGMQARVFTDATCFRSQLAELGITV